MSKTYQVQYRIGFEADTNALKQQLSQVNQQLLAIGQNNGANALTPKMQQAAQAANELYVHLNQAVNVNTGKLDLSKFNQSLKTSGMTLEQYRAKLQAIGQQGTQAFIGVAQSILAADAPIRRTNAALDKMWTTMKNTARWQISSTALRALTTGVREAYDYAKDLNESLNNIRIVTGKSTDEMAKFAKQANVAAKALSTTTNDYSKASLIYYQQGLDGQAVLERANTTVKLANVVGETAETVSEWMTSVWNNFDDGTKSLEHYADVMTALGAATASSADEIAGGLEKFAAISNTVGLSYEYAASALATITAQTRQSEDVVGTALKTIFARIEGLNLGETLDDGTTLNKYSEALYSVGVNIKDNNGQLKDMDTILNEMGNKWQTISKDQQIALAQTVGGMRQYNQLIALMDNWDFFQENLETARNATGELDKQHEIYEESWEAASKRLKASAESIYGALLDDDAFIAMTNGLADIVDMISRVVDSMGGMGGALSLIGMMMTKMFSSQIAEGLRNMVYNTGLATGAERKRAEATKESARQALEAAKANKQLTESQQIQLQNVTNKSSAYQDAVRAYEKMDSYTRSLVDTEKHLVELAETRAQKEVEILANLEKENQTKKFQLESRSVTHSGNIETITSSNYDVGRINSALQAYNELQASIKDLQVEYDQLNSKDIKTEDEVQRLEVLEQQLKEGGKAAKEMNQEMSKMSKEIQSRHGIKTIKGSLGNEKLASLNEKLVNKSNQAVAKVTGDQTSGITKEELDDLAKGYQNVGNASQNANNSSKNLYKTQEEYGRKVIKTIQGQKDWATSLTATANKLTSVTFAISSFRSILDTLNNDDLSFFDKFLNISMSLSMAIPGVIASINLLKSVTKALKSEVIADTLVRVANTLAIKAQAKAMRDNDDEHAEELAYTGKDTKQHIKNTLAQMAENGVRKNAKVPRSTGFKGKVGSIRNGVLLDVDKNGKQHFYNAGNKMDSLNQKDAAALYNKGSIGGGIAGLKEGAIYTGQILKNLLAILAPYLVIAAGIAVIAAGIVVMNKQINKYKDAAKEAAKTTAAIKEQVTQIKSEYDDVVTTISNYETKVKGLETLVPGTNEFKTALQEANDEAIKLLHTYDDIINQRYKVGANGVIEINADALADIEKEKSAQLAQANFALVAAQTYQREAELMVKKVEFARDTMKYTDGTFGTHAGNTAAGAGIGAAGGALIGVGATMLGATAIGQAAIPVPVVGALIGLAVGGIAAAITTATVGAATEKEIKALDNLANVYEEQGDAIFASADSLEAVLKGEKLQIEDSDLIKSLTENVAATRDLIKEIEKKKEETFKDRELQLWNTLGTQDWFKQLGEIEQERIVKQYASDEVLWNQAAATTGQYDGLKGKELEDEYLKALKGEDADKFYIKDGALWEIGAGENGSDKKISSDDVNYTEEAMRTYLEGSDTAKIIIDKIKANENNEEQREVLTEKYEKIKLMAGDDGSRQAARFNTSPYGQFAYGTINEEDFKTRQKEQWLNDFDAIVSTLDPKTYVTYRSHGVSSTSLKSYKDLLGEEEYKNQIQILRKDFENNINNEKMSFREAYNDAYDKFKQRLIDAEIEAPYGSEVSTSGDFKENQEYIGISNFSLIPNSDKSISTLVTDVGEIKQGRAQAKANQLNQKANEYSNIDKQKEKQGQLQTSLGMTKDAFDAYSKAIQEANGIEEDNIALTNEIIEQQYNFEENTKNLNTTWNEWKDALKNKDDNLVNYYKGLDTIAQSINKNLNFTGIEIDQSWLEETPERLQLVEQWANGSAEAYTKLRKEIVKTYIQSDKLDLDEEVQKEILKVYDTLSMADYQIGDQIDTTAINNLYKQLIANAKISAQAIEDIFNSINISFGRKWLSSEENSGLPGMQKFLQQHYSDAYVGTDGDLYRKNSDGSQTRVAGMPIVSGLDRDGNYKQRELTPTEYKALRNEGRLDGFGDFQTVNKVSGSGMVYEFNGEETNVKIPGGEGSTPSLKDKSEIEKYKRVNDLIETNTRLREENAEKLKRLAKSTDILNFLDKEAEGIEASLGFLSAKHAEAQGYIEDTITLFRDLGDPQLVLDFDDWGNISNYTAVTEHLYKLYNEAALANDEASMTLYEDLLNKLKELESDINISRKTGQQYQEEERKLADNKLEKLEKEIEFREKIKDLKEKDIELSKNLFKIYSNDAFDEFLNDQSYLDEEIVKVYGDIQDSTNAIKDYYALLSDPKADEAAIQKNIEKLQDTVISSTAAFNELIATVGQILPSTFEHANSEFEKFTQDLIHNQDILKQVDSIMTLMAGEDADNSLFLKQNQVQSAKAMLESSRAALSAQKGFFDIHKEKEEEAWRIYRETGTESAKTTWEEVHKITQEAEKKLLEQGVATLEAAQDLYEKSLAEAAQAFEDTITDNAGFEMLQAKYDNFIQAEERYLDAVNSSYEINKWNRQLQDDIDKTTSAHATKMLKNLQKEIDLRAKNGKLTKYDLDLLNAKYEITKAQIALEETQNNKTTARLVRDASGNYTYRFTANEDKVSEAQQKLDDANNKWYNLTKDQIGTQVSELMALQKSIAENASSADEDTRALAKEQIEQYEFLYGMLEQAGEDFLEAGGDEEYLRAMKNMVKSVSTVTKATNTLLSDANKYQQQRDDDMKEIGNIIGKGYTDNDEIVRQLTLESVNIEDKMADTLNSIDKKLRNAFESFDKANTAIIEALKGLPKDMTSIYESLLEERKNAGENINYASEYLAAISRGNDAAAQAALNKRVQGGSKVSNKELQVIGSIWDQMNQSQKDELMQLYNDGILNDEEAISWLKAQNEEARKQAEREGKAAELLSEIKKIDAGEAAALEDYWSRGIITLDALLEAFNRLSTESQIGSSSSKGGSSSSKGGSSSSSNPYAGLSEYETAVAIMGKESADAWLESQKIVQAETGGYTGAWGDSSGKLAILHEKELVLNKEDTANILSSVGIVRNLNFNAIAQAIEKLAQVSGSLASSMLNGILGYQVGEKVIQQNVTIEASFPGVQSALEIEMALDNIVNDATQFATTPGF